MLTSLRPRLRPGLAASRDGNSSDFVYLYDTWRQSPQPLRLTLAEFRLVEQMNGQQTCRSFSNPAWRCRRRAAPGCCTRCSTRLEDGLYLDGPNWQTRLAAPVREPSCLGTYAPECPGTEEAACTSYFYAPAIVRTCRILTCDPTAACAPCWPRTSIMVAAAGPTPGRSRNWSNRRRARCS